MRIIFDSLAKHQIEYVRMAETNRTNLMLQCIMALCNAYSLGTNLAARVSKDGEVDLYYSNRTEEKRHILENRDVLASQSIGTPGLGRTFEDLYLNVINSVFLSDEVILNDTSNTPVINIHRLNPNDISIFIAKTKHLIEANAPYTKAWDKATNDISAGIMGKKYGNFANPRSALLLASSLLGARNEGDARVLHQRAIELGAVCNQITCNYGPEIFDSFPIKPKSFRYGSRCEPQYNLIEKIRYGAEIIRLLPSILNIGLTKANEAPFKAYLTLKGKNYILTVYEDFLGLSFANRTSLDNDLHKLADTMNESAAALKTAQQACFRKVEQAEEVRGGFQAILTNINERPTYYQR